MTAFTLKMIALVSMCIDHLGYFLYKGLSNFNYIGRLAFPIFAYQITEGYEHTRDLKKYFLRLFLFSLISQIPFMLFLQSVNISPMRLNIFFTLFLGLLCILVYDKFKHKLASIALIALIAVLGELLRVDYGYWGVLLIFVFYLCKNNKLLMAFAFLGMCLIEYFYGIFINFNLTSALLCLFTFLSIVPILLYNGKLGLKTKRLLYVFYPGHLLVLWIASLI